MTWLNTGVELLAQLQRELDVFHGGERPNYDLILDIIRRLREAGDRGHHRREDAAFARLAAREPDTDLRLARLRQEQEEDVLPRAAAVLTPGDWQAVAAAGPRESLQQ